MADLSDPSVRERLRADNEATAQPDLFKRAALDLIENLIAGQHRVRALVDVQAEDDGLWFIAQTAPEAYQQQCLRELHALIERALSSPEHKESR